MASTLRVARDGYGVWTITEDGRRASLGKAPTRDRALRCARALAACLAPDAVKIEENRRPARPFRRPPPS